MHKPTDKYFGMYLYETGFFSSSKIHFIKFKCLKN